MIFFQDRFASVINILLTNVKMRYGYPRPAVEQSLVDKKYLIYEGTIRNPPDKDEGWLLACADHATTIFDIGSNIGQAAFVSLYPQTVKKIVLVDPNPIALSVAAENLIYNHLVHRACFFCGFVSDVDGENVQFWTTGVGAAGSMYRSFARTAAKKNEYLNVPTCTLDNLVNWFGEPDLVKIDVEGAETKVLNGSKILASKRQTRFFVEMHSGEQLPIVENTQRLLAWCNAMEYTAWYLRTSEPITSPDQVKNRGRFHTILQPKEWEFPEWLSNLPQAVTLENISMQK